MMNKIYTKIFASVYDRFMFSIENSLFPIRKKLVSELKGDILEIGVGTGVNFKFYDPDTNVIAIDPSAAMIAKAIPKIPTKASIELLEYGATDDNFVDYIGEKKFDAIICTLVLCTIPDPQKAIGLFHKMLKKEGKLIVMEHIQHETKWKANLFSLFNPMWKVIGEGCNLNRHTDQIIKELGFVSINPEEEIYFKRTIPFYANVFVKEIIAPLQ